MTTFSSLTLVRERSARLLAQHVFMRGTLDVSCRIEHMTSPLRYAMEVSVLLVRLM